MKKLIATVTVFWMLFFAQFSWAGSSRIIHVDKTSFPDVRIAIYAEGDSISDLTIDKDDYKINGLVIYGIKTTPTSPDAAYDVAVSDEDGYVMCDATSRSTSTAEGFACNQTALKYEKVLTDLTVAVDDLGAGSTIIDIDFLSTR